MQRKLTSIPKYKASDIVFFDFNGALRTCIIQEVNIIIKEVFDLYTRKIETTETVMYKIQFGKVTFEKVESDLIANLL